MFAAADSELLLDFEGNSEKVGIISRGIFTVANQTLYHLVNPCKNYQSLTIRNRLEKSLKISCLSVRVTA